MKMADKRLCSQKTKTGLCGKPAVANMRWPGETKDLFVCAEHKKKGEAIAAAMGFIVRFDKIDE
jgi:hypothetical protein